MTSRSRTGIRRLLNHALTCLLAVTALVALALIAWAILVTLSGSNLGFV
ncbi:hypothetical protein [Streptomyces sp. NBC_00102]|nr:hypothetical protein [Streptomyces sp. NBC_00102]MCX5398428.1 hypothetical protein [Streptomyces sp. NBC_00102]